MKKIILCLLASISISAFAVPPPILGTKGNTGTGDVDHPKDGILSSSYTNVKPIYKAKVQVPSSVVRGIYMGTTNTRN